MSKQADVENFRMIRDALLIGLECFGEVERVIDRFQTLQSLGKPVDSELRPLHPTGNSEVIGMFAAALRTLGTMEEANV